MIIDLRARTGAAWPNLTRDFLQGLAIVSALAILAFAGYTDRAALLLLALLGGFAALVTIRWPMPALLLGLILTSGPLAFFGLPLPALLNGGGLEINVLDAIIALTGAIGIASLWRRREWPIFWWPLVILGGAILLSWVAGTIVGTTDIVTGLNGIRPLLPYLLYFAGCGIVDSPAKLRILAMLPLGCVAIAVPFQFWNLLTVTPTVDNRIVVGGVPVLYHSLILADYVLIGAVFAFALLTGVDSFRPRLLVLGILGLAMGGVALKFTRQYYVFVVVGCAAVFLFSLGRDRLRGVRPLLYVPAILLPLLLLANAWLSPRLGNSLFTVVALRGAEILRPHESENALVRVESTRRMWHQIEEAPLFGTGPNQVLGNDLSGEFYFTDVGFQSTLYFYGAVGLLGALGVAGAIALRAKRTLRIAGDRLFRAYLLGALGTVAGMLVCYGFAQDFFTFTLAPVVFILVVADRAHRFSVVPSGPASPAWTGVR